MNFKRGWRRVVVGAGLQFAGRVEDGRDFERSWRGGIGVGIECGFRFGQGGLDRAEVIRE